MDNQIFKSAFGIITEQAKFKLRIEFPSKWLFLRRRKSEIDSTHLLILAWGKRATNFIESSSMPAKDNVVAGPHVFSGAMQGRPISSHNARKLSKCRFWQILLEDETIKKYRLTNVGSYIPAVFVGQSIGSLCWKFQRSCMHELTQPIGIHRS